MTLFIMSGIPGSGKSTLAAEMSEKWNIGIVSSDDIRREVLESMGMTDVAHPDDIPDHERKAEITKKVESKVWEKIHGEVNHYLTSGEPVIVDTTAAKKMYIMEWVNKANYHGVRTKIIMMSTSFFECIKRNKNRERVVPDHVLSGMFESWMFMKTQLKMDPELSRYVLSSDYVMDMNPLRENRW